MMALPAPGASGPRRLPLQGCFPLSCNNRAQTRWVWVTKLASQPRQQVHKAAHHWYYPWPEKGLGFQSYPSPPPPTLLSLSPRRRQYGQGILQTA